MLFNLTLDSGENQIQDLRITLRFCRECEATNEPREKRCSRCNASLPPPIRAYPVGAKLREKYRIERLLGAGGMGIVYEATHLLLRRPVALKCIHPHIVSDGNVLARFQREAIAASSIEHPNALRVVDLDVAEDGAPILVTELLVGRDLERAIRAGEKFPLPRIVHLLSQALDALSVAHKKGILHRDIKPQNLFLVEQDGQEQVKLVDFGLAKLLAPDKDTPQLTSDGMSMGTPAYMSPEQVRGESLDARSDLWSIGVILYQFMTNRLPFSADSAMSTAMAVLRDEVESPTVIDEAQRALWLLCKRALSKDREHRPESAQRFREELQKILAHYQKGEPSQKKAPLAPELPTPSIPMPSLTAPRRWPLVVAFGALAAALAVYFSWPASPSALPKPLPESLPAASLPASAPATLALLPESLPTSSSQPIETTTKPTPNKSNRKDPKEPKETKETKDPKTALTPPAGQSKFTFGKGLVLSGKYKDAVLVLEQVVKEEPKNASAHRWLGDAYKGANKRSQAIAQWQEFIRLDPAHPDVKKVQSQIDALR